MSRNWYLTTFWVLVFNFHGKAQQPVDTIQIRQWIDSAWANRLDHADKALQFARKTLEASKDKYPYGMMKGNQIAGEAYFTKGIPDTALLYYHKALSLARTQKNKHESAYNYNGLASIHFEFGRRDSAIYYFELAINIFQTLRDSSEWCASLLRYGNTLNSLGELDKAMAAYVYSLKICEAIHDEEYIAYNYGAIAILLDRQKSYTQAEEYFLKALAQFRKIKDLYGQMSIYNNIGILYKNMKQYEKALDAYTQCLALADSIQFDKGRVYAMTNIGTLNVQMGQFENGIRYNTRALQLGREYQFQELVADNLNTLARGRLGLHDLQHALIDAKEALQVSKEVKSLDKQLDANLTLSEIFQAQQVYDSSLYYFKAYSVVRDTLFSQEKSKQITELQARYETAKKDKEILELAGKAAIDRIRKTRLWIGLGLSLLAGGLLVYAQRSRRIRDNKILSQEKELEVERRKTSELEKETISRALDLKKQELAAKALQLARKNEFLQSLNTEVDKMREHTQGVAADAARKISQHIRMDIESENDWEQFLTSFREVHRDFMEGLHQVYPDLTKSEIRLACLMKMNLSAKEQAALLNVTADGIKKARYRLRKSMELDSEVDIQDYLLGFPMAVYTSAP